MEIIVGGKNAVLDHLENDSRERTGGKPGEYMLAKDDNGNLFAVIAGHTFSGTGTVVFGAKTLKVENGILMDIAGD
jgi:hypothetical protein